MRNTFDAFGSALTGSNARLAEGDAHEDDDAERKRYRTIFISDVLWERRAARRKRCLTF